MSTCERDHVFVIFSLEWSRNIYAVHIMHPLGVHGKHPTGDGLSRRHRRHVLATTAAETVACAPGSALAIPGISKGMPPPSSQPGIANHPPQQVECCQGCLLQLPVAPLRMQCDNIETQNSQNQMPMQLLVKHVYLNELLISYWRKTLFWCAWISSSLGNLSTLYLVVND